MQHLLEVEFSQLLRDVEALMEQIKSANTPKELRQFQYILLNLCEDIQDELKTHLIMIELVDEANILKDLFKELSRIKTSMQQFSAILVPPAIQAAKNELLGLVFANWIHNNHLDTQFSGVAVTTGRWEVRTSVRLTIYHIPLLEQTRLLHLPLLFHEFGHVLFLKHRPEMDDLVQEFQDMILHYLEPARRRNDAYTEKRTIPRQKAIVYTWYSWLVELYCDAVGMEIGGECYLRAFSTYLRHFRIEDFFQSEKNLTNSSHPITWLRVRLLLNRASKYGFSESVEQIEPIWKAISITMNVTEDYFGYYDDMLAASLMDIIDDMLIQTNPKRYDTEDTDYLNFNIDTVNPVQLANAAWLRFEAAPQEYYEWEAHIIKRFLQRFN